MRILVCGCEGTVGKAAISGLSKGHEIIKAGRTTGDIQVDLMDEVSVRAMYQKLGFVDAVIAATGHSHFCPVASMTPTQFLDGLKDVFKLFVISFFKRFNFLLQVFVGEDQFSQFSECAHYLYIYLDRSFAVKHRREHENAVIRKNSRTFPCTAPT